jgi:hypothetical protein
MNKVLLKLTAKMLDIAQDEFSNNGCNDLYEDTWDYADMTQSDKDELLKDIRLTLGYSEEDMPCIESVGDTTLMGYLKRKLLEQANNPIIAKTVNIEKNIGDIHM